MEAEDQCKMISNTWKIVNVETEMKNKTLTEKKYKLK